MPLDVAGRSRAIERVCPVMHQDARLLRAGASETGVAERAGVERKAEDVEDTRQRLQSLAAAEIEDPAVAPLAERVERIHERGVGMSQHGAIDVVVDDERRGNESRARRKRRPLVGIGVQRRGPHVQDIADAVLEVVEDGPGRALRLQRTGEHRDHPRRDSRFSQR